MNTINSNTGVLYIVVVPIVVILLLAVSVLFAPHIPDSEKVSVYDCGIIAIGDTRGQFPIAYYVVAILFLVFDLEIVLLYPISLCIDSVQVLGFWVVIIFLFLLTIGFVFELGSGVLAFTAHRTRDLLQIY